MSEWCVTGLQCNAPSFEREPTVEPTSRPAGIARASSVRDFCNQACHHLELDCRFAGLEAPRLHRRRERIARTLVAQQRLRKLLMVVRIVPGHAARLAAAGRPHRRDPSSSNSWASLPSATRTAALPLQETRRPARRCTRRTNLASGRDKPVSAPGAGTGPGADSRPPVTLCPGNNISARKRKHGHTGDAGTYIKPMLVQAAWAAIRSGSRPGTTGWSAGSAGTRTPARRRRRSPRSRTPCSRSPTRCSRAGCRTRSQARTSTPGGNHHSEAGLAGAPAAKAPPRLHRRSPSPSARRRPPYYPALNQQP